MMALRVSFGLSFESMKSMTTLRPAMPPPLLTTFAHAFMASTDFLNRPGCDGRVDVGDDREPDLGVGDADVVGLGRGALRAGDRDGRTDQCDDGDRDRQYP